MDYTTYQVTIVQALQELYAKVASNALNLVVAIIVLIVGWLISTFLSQLVLKLLDVLKIDHLANQLGLGNLSERTGRKLSLARLGAWLVKWFFILVTILATANILGLTQVSEFLYQKALPYAGNVVVAMAILLLGVLVANFFSGIVATTVKASGFVSSGTLAAITKWLIIVFAVVTALKQLQIDTTLIDSLIKAIIAMFAIAGGIAFGLGGKEHASRILDHVEDGLTKKV